MLFNLAVYGNSDQRVNLTKFLMKLCTIINFWDCSELLPYVIKNISPLVDGVIIVFSDYSNYNEFTDNTALLKYLNFDAHLFRCEPLKTLSAVDNERRRRNFGLQKARELGFTHFLDQDCDEFYEAEPFLKEKERFLNPDLNGLCCACQTYFKSPQLTIGLDVTIVPFIHKITPRLTHAFNRHYPFAFVNGQIRVDPTRQLTYYTGIEWSNVITHHYSYVRRDINLKIRNSTARNNLERSTILNDLLHAKEGYFCEYYQKTLVRASVDFNIPEYGFNTDSPRGLR